MNNLLFVHLQKQVVTVDTLNSAYYLVLLLYLCHKTKNLDIGVGHSKLSEHKKFQNFKFS